MGIIKGFSADPQIEKLQKKNNDPSYHFYKQNCFTTFALPVLHNPIKYVISIIFPTINTGIKSAGSDIERKIKERCAKRFRYNAGENRMPRWGR